MIFLFWYNGRLELWNWNRLTDCLGMFDAILHSFNLLSVDNPSANIWWKCYQLSLMYEILTGNVLFREKKIKIECFHWWVDQVLHSIQSCNIRWSFSHFSVLVDSFLLILKKKCHFNSDFIRFLMFKVRICVGSWYWLSKTCKKPNFMLRLHCKHKLLCKIYWKCPKGD